MDVEKSAMDSEQDAGDNRTVKEFKTPSFIIPSTKRVQRTSSNIEDVFKSPENTSKMNDDTSSNKTEEKKIDDLKRDDSKEIEKHIITENSKSKDALKQAENIEYDKMDNSKKVKAKPSPAEQFKHSQAPIPYKEPPWSGLSEDTFSFEVIKNGAVIDKVDLKGKAYHVIGRLPSCDIPMEHPSLSRYHAVVQYSSGSSETFPKGWYLYDLDSTHGTWINKNRVPPKKYHRLHVDYVLKYGGSTRLFILHGPDSDREEESELSVNEMKEQRERQIKEAEVLRQAEIAEEEKKAEMIRKQEEDRGCSWGIGDDVAEEDEDEENPFAVLTTENEDLYIDDPKKSLNGYYEREGYDPPQYEFTDAGFGKRKCTVELPIDGPNGEPLMAEVVLSGKKKEAVIQCALEACRVLDRHGLLRKATHESRKKKERNWEDDDYYDSDEDIYLDRTGTIEKKRQIRMNKVGKSGKSTETYESLVEKHQEIVKEMQEIEAKLEQAKAEASAFEYEDVDALDAYMTAIKSGAMDTKTKMKLKCRLLELKQEEQKTRKLVNIAKPASLPELKPVEKKSDTMKSSLLSGVGKIRGLQHKQKTVKPVSKPVSKPEETEFVPEEEDDDEEEDNKMDQSEIRLKSHSIIKNVKTESLKPDTSSMSLEIQHALKAAQSDKTQAQSSSIKGPEKPVTENKTKTVTVKGPTLPLAAVLEQLQEDSDMLDSVDIDENKKRKLKDKADANKKVKSAEYDSSDPDYAVWLPPDNQAGDGKTFLNAKFGY